MTHVKNAIYQETFRQRHKNCPIFRQRQLAEYRRYNKKRLLYKSIINEFYKIQLCFFD